jgi:hypothetical protein
MKKASQVTYTLSPNEIKEILTDYLEVRGKNVDVRFHIEERGGDPMDRYPGTPTVIEVNVTVKEK